MTEQERQIRFRQRIKQVGITGCQRSGTTLIGLLFKVRHDCTYFGEGKSVFAYRDCYDVKTPIAVYQLTTMSQRVEDWHRTTYRIWMVRNIYDVVSSMIKLDWVKRGLAGNEIKECIERLSDNEREYCEKLVSSFNWTDDLHLIASLTYLLKHRFAEYHRNVIRVKYEDLVRNAESELRKICDFCGIVFDESMLNHHAKLDGELHGTNFSRSIDTSSINRSSLTDLQKGQIDALRVGFVSMLDSVPTNLL